MTNQIDELRKQLESLQMSISTVEVMQTKFKDDVEELRSHTASIKSNTGPLPRHWLYPVIFLIILVFVGALVVYGRAANPTVAITYNVGDIIGGLMVGIGAILASIAYARSKGEVE